MWKKIVFININIGLNVLLEAFEILNFPRIQQCIWAQLTFMDINLIAELIGLYLRMKTRKKRSPWCGWIHVDLAHHHGHCRITISTFTLFSFLLQKIQISQNFEKTFIQFSSIKKNVFYHLNWARWKIFNFID